MKKFIRRLRLRYGDPKMLPAYALAFIFLLVWLGRLHSTSALERELLERNAQITRLAPIVEKIAELENGAAAVRSALNAPIEALHMRRAVPQFLRKLRESPSKGVAFEEITINYGGDGSLSVSARRAAELDAWLAALRPKQAQESPGFEIIEASTSTPSPSRAALLVRFKLR